MNKKYNTLGYYIVSFFAFILPFNTKFPILITLSLALLLLIGIIKNGIPQSVKNIIEQKLSKNLLILFAIFCCTFFYSVNNKEFISFLQVKVTFLILAFAIVQFELSAKMIKNILLIFVQGLIFSTLLLFVIGTFQYIKNHNVSYFTLDCFSMYLRLQAGVLSMYCLIGIIILFKMIKEKEHKTKTFKAILIFYLLWFGSLVLFLASKIIVVIAVILMTHKLICTFLKFKNNKITKSSFFILIIIFSLGILLYLAKFNVLQNRFRGFQNMHFAYTDTRGELHHNETFDSTRWTTFSYRAALAQCTWEAIKQNLFFGVGIGGRHAALTKAYERHGFILAIQRHSLPHNTYLEIMLAIGFVGFIIFLYIMFYLPFIISLRKKNSAYIEMLIVIAIVFVFDNYLDRLQGLCIVSLVYCIIMYENKHESVENDDIKICL